MATISKKVCLLGDFSVGKTSLVRRFIYDRFDDKYISTIGVKVSRKTIIIPYGNDVLEVTLMLWDLAGSEEFTDVRASYLRGSAGAILVCDLTRKDTLMQLTNYVDDLRSVSPDAQLVVAANKSDLMAQHQVSIDQVSAVADKLQAPFYVTSAKEGDEVENVFRHLARQIVN